MLSVFFYLLQISTEEIPFQFNYLANKAINNSLTDIQNENTKYKQYPGNYHYPNIEFTLMCIVTAPSTDEIKGFFIDGNYIAIVKNKNFNLTNNFAFIDPSSQKIYKMTQLVAFNDSINIYSANEISIYDIMTNFKCHTRALKDQQFLIFSDNETNNPKMYKIYDNQYFFMMGFLTYGTVSTETSFSFNSKFDVYIKSSISVEMNLNYQMKVPFNCSFNSTGNLNKSPLKELHQKQSYSDQDNEFSFLGYIISTNTYINFDFNASNCQIFVPIDFETSNNYYLIGSKYIEITPYSKFDSRWILQMRNYGENITSTDNLKNTVQNYQFKITFFLSFYVTIEFNIGQSNTIYNCGFNIIIPLLFTYDLLNCLSNYLFGYIRNSAYGFYNYSGYSILNGIEIIKPINVKNSITIDGSSYEYYCFGNVDKVYVKEGYQPLYDIDQYSLVVENFSVYWSSLPDFDSVSLLSSVDHDCQLFMKANNLSNNHVVFNDLLPSQTFSTSSENPTKINRQFISPLIYSSNRPTVEIFFYYKYWCDYVTNGCQSQSCSHTISTSLGTYNHWISHKAYPRLFYQNRVDLLKNIQVSRLFNDFKSTDISFIPNDESNYSLLIFETTNSIKIDEKAEFSIKLSPKGPVKSIGKVMNKNDYISIALSTLYIKKTYYFNNIYVICDGLEEGIISRKLLPVKSYSKSNLNCSDFKVRLYVPEIQNRKIKIGLDFHDFGQSPRVKYTEIDIKKIGPEYGLYTEIDSYTENTASFVFKIISEIPTNVKASNKTNMKYEMVVKTTYISIYDHTGNFIIYFSQNDVYSIIEISVSSNISLAENDLIISIENIELIFNGIKKISQNIYCIPCSQIHNNIIKIPVRRVASFSISRKFLFRYLIAKFYNQNNYSMNLEGQEIIFSSPRTAYAFQVPSTYYLDKITNHLVNSFTEYEIKKYAFTSSIFAIMHKNPNCPNKLTFAYPILLFKNQKVMNSYNTSFLENILTEDRMNYSVVVNTKSRYVRYNDQLQTTYYNAPVFYFNKTGVFDFYAVCYSSYESMCEINYQKSSNDGDYDLLKFPTRDGINLTERGMFTGFIYAPQGKNISYYKSFTGEISVIKSYNNSTKIHLDVDDFENNNTLLENTNDENISGYRQFCMKDDDENNIPLSLKFINNNLTSLMKHLGINDDFNASQYSITDDDCLVVKFSAIITNNIKYVPTDACDLPTNESVIPIVKNKIVYHPKFTPTKMFSETEKFSITFYFSQSNIFSDSNAFTDSGVFSISHVFSNSKSFSNSLTFKNSCIFSNSNGFTRSDYFSKSNDFSYSKHFSHTNIFSISVHFTISNSFSSSLIQTSAFSLSSQFSDSFTFSETPTQSLYGEMHSLSMHLTYSYIRTVTFSVSYIKSYSYSICFNSDFNTYTACKIESSTPDYFPYIIYSLSPSYTQLAVLVEFKHVKRISPAQLIGIVCGSCAVLFAIVGITIMIIRKKKNLAGLVENISETTSLIENHEAKQVNINLQKSAHSADDIWL